MHRRPTRPYSNVGQSMTAQTLQQLPRSEKLKLMEALWEDLSRPDSELQSPAWHTKELAATKLLFCR
jgi:hypothetical protein